MDIPAEELTHRTFSLAMDIGMYFSQVLMKNYPSLKWEQPLGKKRFADYGQPCLVGFGPVSPNPVRIGHVFAHGLRVKPTPAKDCEKFTITGQSSFERNLELLRPTFRCIASSRRRSALAGVVGLGL
jgi:hypothetical protein